MSSMYLITSVPPSRAAEAKVTFDLWHALGVTIYTINTPDEIRTLAGFIPKDRIIAAPKDLRSQYGRPLISISDAIRAIVEIAPLGAPCAIVNADVTPNKMFDWDATCEHLHSRELMLFKRTDFSWLNNADAIEFQPNVYRYGYDLFLFRNDAHAVTLASDESGDLAFGVPWWDYWFPVKALVAEFSVTTVETCSILHERHEENFSQELWHKKGRQFLDFLVRPSSPLQERIRKDKLDAGDLLPLCDLVVDFLDMHKFTSRKLPSSFCKGVTIVTACMNRNANLRCALETWLRLSDIDEIIVVDWASSEPVSKTLSDITDSRVRIVRADEPTKWNLCLAFNLGFRHVRHDKILKLDADVCLEVEFLRAHELTSGVFYTGSWKHARNDAEKRLNGSFLAWSEDIFAVGGYNNVIDSYGWDDSDLYHRISKLSRNLHFDTRYISHLEQTQKSRIENTKINPDLKKIHPSVYTELEIRKNEFKAFLLQPVLGLHSDSDGLSHRTESPNPDLLYKHVLINELKRPYGETGLSLSMSFLANLSMRGLYTLYKYRHMPYSWRHSIRETYRHIANLPFSKADLSCFANHPESPFLSPHGALGFIPGILSNSFSDSKPDTDARFTRLLGLPPRPGTYAVENEPYYVNEIALKSKSKSVVIPVVVFNAADFLKPLLDDIRQQTAFDNCLFVFVVADGQIYPPLESFCSNFPDNTTLVLFVDDPGLYDCWNFVIHNSCARYVSNWNVDDRRAPEHLKTLIGILDSKPEVDAVASALYVSNTANKAFEEFGNSDTRWFSERDIEFDHRNMFQYTWWSENPAERRTVTSNNYLHCMPVWRRSLHDRYGYFDEHTYGASADWEFWLRCGLSGAQYFLTKKLLGAYYFNPASYGRATPRVLELEKRIIERYLSYAELS